MPQSFFADCEFFSCVFFGARVNTNSGLNVEDRHPKTMRAPDEGIGFHVPQDASSIEREAFDRVLILGEPHSGKSTSVTASAAEAFGLGYVINCGKKTGLLDAARKTSKFKFDIVRDHAGMEESLKEARRGSKEGLYHWIALDDFNLYASWLEVALEDQTRNAKGEADGRRFWREYRKSLVNILVRLFDMKAHIYVISHYIETGGGLIDGQTEKTGQGVAPMFAGAARKEIPGMFSDIVFMAPSTKDSAKRSFHINPVGVFGPSCLSAPGTREIPADVGLLHEAFKNATGAKGAKR